MNLEDVLVQAKDRDSVHITLVSNQDNGIASYAVGDLIFHAATGGQVLNGPRFRPAHLDSAAGKPLTIFFSDRRRQENPRQPFPDKATETLGVSVAPGSGNHTAINMKITVCVNSATLAMQRHGEVFVGFGPSLGHSSQAVYVLAFTGVVHPPS